VGSEDLDYLRLPAVLGPPERITVVLAVPNGRIGAGGEESGDDRR
jgi:hypothetical protein